MSAGDRLKELYPHLFSPIRIGNIRLKNRIIAAPTSPHMLTTQGHLTAEMVAYLEKKAMGGAAVVTMGESIVHSATGKSHNKQHACPPASPKPFAGIILCKQKAQIEDQD